MKSTSISIIRGVRPQEARSLMRRAVRQGWAITVTNGGHIRLTPPDGGTPIIAALTSSGGRGVNNLRSLLKRAGVDVG
jgi:hypothetical protein